MQSFTYNHNPGKNTTGTGMKSSALVFRIKYGLEDTRPIALFLEAYDLNF